MMIAAISIGDLFAAGEVAFIMALGAILEDMITNRAKKGLKELVSLDIAQGRRITDGKEKMISVKDICVNDTIRILAGEVIPVDGVIIKGETSIDQSIITGESLPVDKTIDDRVFSGTMNHFGSIDIRATNVGEDSSLQKLIRMVKDAEDKKAPMARIADKCASWLVPVALLIAIITGLVTKDITRAVTVLVVFCPCALVLATPTAIMAAIGQATKHGVIVKSGEALERMGKVDTIAFDKTGTLTYGRLEVSNIVSFDREISDEELLSFVASAEAKSEHPLGKAIVERAKSDQVSIIQSDSFTIQPGKGIQAVINGSIITCGNEKYLKEIAVQLSEHKKKTLDSLRIQGKASVIIAKGSRCIGVIALSDVIKPDAKEVVESLRSMNTDSLLLTGDSRVTVEYFASKVGLSEIKAELLPEQKVESIVQMQAESRTVCMIGDGVNDAPALKTADVGVAMGSIGSDIAIEAADIALMNDDISKIPYLKWLSNTTVNTIKGAITLSMCINFIAVALSVLGLLNPTTGALVHNAGSCFVVLLAALLYDRKYNEGRRHD